MEYYLVMKKSEVLINGTTWITFANSQRSQPQKATYCKTEFTREGQNGQIYRQKLDQQLLTYRGERDKGEWD